MLTQESFSVGTDGSLAGNETHPGGLSAGRRQTLPVAAHKNMAHKQPDQPLR
jgi:hypothetical protein